MGFKLGTCSNPKSQHLISRAINHVQMKSSLFTSEHQIGYFSTGLSDSENVSSGPMFDQSFTISK